MTNTNVGILPWRNETGLLGYPLTSNVLTTSDVIVDAYWIQFDSFVPVLKTIKVEALQIVFTFSTDEGDVVAALEWPATESKLDVVEPVLGRLLGRIFLGDGIESYYNSNLGSTITYNTPFVASTVHGVPYDSGVFSFHGATGDVVVAGDGNLFFTAETQGVIFDAVGIPACDPTINPLLSVNGISASNIKLDTNDIINWLPAGNGIKLELATGNIFNISVQSST